MRFGVREIRERTAAHGNTATHELLDIGEKANSEIKVLTVGSQEQCLIVCKAIEEAYVAGADANANRVVLDGKAYRVVTD